MGDIQLVENQQNGTDILIKMAIDKNLDIEKLQKLIDLKNEEDARICKKEFFLHYAEMQKDFIPAQKSKEVSNKYGKHLYNYAPLDDILKVYQPILSQHGFSYRWDLEPIPSGGEVRIWCIISGYGHEIKTFMDIIIEKGNDFTNNNQQRGSALTYGKRYTFCNVLGIILEGEDKDGLTDKVEDIKPLNNQRNITPEKKETPSNNKDDHKEKYRKRLREVAEILLEEPFNDVYRKKSKEVLLSINEKQSIEDLDKYAAFLDEEKKRLLKEKGAAE